MRVRKYLLCAQWLNNLMIMLLWFAVIEWFLSMLNISLSPLYMTEVIAVICCSYICRVYIMKLLPYAGIHLLVFLILYFIPLSPPYKAIGFIVLIVFTICDLMFLTWTGVRSFNIVHPAMVISFLLIFAYASWNDYTELLRKAYVCGVCFGGMFFLRTYLINCIRFATDMMVNESTPVDDMFKHNGRIVFPLVTGLTAAMFLIQSDSLAHVLSGMIKFLLNCLGKFIGFIFSLLPMGEEGVDAVPGQTFMPGLEPVSVIPDWLLIFMQALEKVAALFIFCLFSYFLVKAVYTFVRRYFIRHGYDVFEVKCEDHTEVRERIRTSGRRTKGIFSGLSEREKIRRKYKSEVERMRRKGYELKKSHTPGERAFDIQNNGKIKVPEGFTVLTDRYEKVRYRE